MFIFVWVAYWFEPHTECQFTHAWQTSSISIVCYVLILLINLQLAMCIYNPLKPNTSWFDHSKLRIKDTLRNTIYYYISLTEIYGALLWFFVSFKLCMEILQIVSSLYSSWNHLTNKQNIYKCAGACVHLFVQCDIHIISVHPISQTNKKCNKRAC